MERILISRIAESLRPFSDAIEAEGGLQGCERARAKAYGAVTTPLAPVINLIDM